MIQPRLPLDVFVTPHDDDDDADGDDGEVEDDPHLFFWWSNRSRLSNGVNEDVRMEWNNYCVSYVSSASCVSCVIFVICFQLHQYFVSDSCDTSYIGTVESTLE